MLLLAKESMTKLLKAFDQDRNGARAWFLPQCFFPFRFVIFGSWTVESCSIGIDAIVQVCTKEAVCALGLPFLCDELYLVLHGFMP